MNIYKCDNCHAIWEDISNPSVCPNCSKTSKSSTSFQKSIHLRFNSSKNTWKILAKFQDYREEKTWKSKPTDDEIFDWIKTALNPLWSK